MAKKLPLRKCTGCQEMKDKRTMVRIVRDSDAHFHVDLTGKLNGRGAYICKSSACLEKALKNNGLERSFKGKVPEDVVTQLKEAFSSFE